ncbi:hypothetical protein Tco_1313024 [Tanacetum coccineum]
MMTQQGYVPLSDIVSSLYNSSYSYVDSGAQINDVDKSVQPMFWLVLQKCTSDHNRSELEIQDHSNEPSSSKVAASENNAAKNDDTKYWPATATLRGGRTGGWTGRGGGELNGAKIERSG